MFRNGTVLLPNSQIIVCYLCCLILGHLSGFQSVQNFNSMDIDVFCSQARSQDFAKGGALLEAGNNSKQI